MTFSVNHPILFVLAGLIIAVVMGQSVYFLAKALYAYWQAAEAYLG